MASPQLQTSILFSKQEFLGFIDSFLLRHFFTTLKGEIDFWIEKSPCIMCVQYIGGGGGGMFSTSRLFSTLGDTMSTLGDIMSTLGDVQYIGRYHEYIGGYHEYIGGCSVRRGIP